MKVFITGVSSGIGRELTGQLVRAGHEVFGVARREAELADLGRELGPRFSFARCDVRSGEDINRVLQVLDARAFLPDVVVLNAATMGPDAREVFETNVLGALGWVEGFVERFLRRGHGQFIAVASISAFRPDGSNIAYAASKAALAMAFRGLRLRYRATPLRFKTIYFGPVATLIDPRFAEVRSRAKTLFVISAERAARAVFRAMQGRRNDSYVPFWLTVAFRLSSLLPDRWYIVLTRPFRR